MPRLTKKACSNAIVKKLVEGVTEKARVALQKLADDYRTCVVLPVCTKHELEFLVGNGSWCFYMDRGDRTVQISDLDDLDGSLSVHDVFGPDVVDDDENQERSEEVVASMVEDMRDVFATLTIDGLGHNDYFGFYVGDVRAGDWTKR